MLRPNSSTSAGQSGGGSRDAVETAGGVDVFVAVDDLSLAMLFFIRAAQSAEEVQERHLDLRVSRSVNSLRVERMYTVCRPFLALRPLVNPWAHHHLSPVEISASGIPYS